MKTALLEVKFEWNINEVIEKIANVDTTAIWKTQGRV